MSDDRLYRSAEEDTNAAESGREERDVSQLHPDVDAILDERYGSVEDVEAEVAPSAASRPTFTASQYAATRPGRTADQARSLLEEFAAAGVVEQVAGGWTLTRLGRRIAGDLAFASGPEEPE